LLYVGATSANENKLFYFFMYSHSFKNVVICRNIVKGGFAMFQKSLRNRLMGMFLAMILIPMIVVTIFVYISMSGMNDFSNNASKESLLTQQFKKKIGILMSSHFIQHA